MSLGYLDDRFQFRYLPATAVAIACQTARYRCCRCRPPPAAPRLPLPRSSRFRHCPPAANTPALALLQAEQLLLCATRSCQ